MSGTFLYGTLGVSAYKHARSRKARQLRPATGQRAPADEDEPQHQERGQPGPDAGEAPPEGQRQPDQRQEADEPADQGGVAVAGVGKAGGLVGGEEVCDVLLGFAGADVDGDEVRLASVTLKTASPGTDARIPGLEPDEAARLRDQLTDLGEARASGL